MWRWLLLILIAGTLGFLGWRYRPLGAIDQAPNSNWLTVTGGPEGHRYSTLAQITRENVRGLRLVCADTIRPSPESFQATPLVRDGVMYLTTMGSTIALDATTCRERWHVDHPPRKRGTLPNNRGAAFAGELLVRGTVDGELIAFDASTGEIRWRRQVTNSLPITMPPLVVDRLIIVGPAGSELAISGWIGAFRVSDGAPVWKFRTIADSTWDVDEGVAAGGGSVWTAMTYDSVSTTVYAATTNPAPDFAGDVRLGDNLYTNSVVALDVNTGRLRWYNQLIPHDTHDYDLTQAGPLVRSGIVATGKDGVVRMLTRATGAMRWSTPISTQKNQSASITRAGTYACPGVYGGVLWSGPAYSPAIGALVVGSIEACGTFTLADSLVFTPGEHFNGGVFGGDVTTWGGRITALDAETGRIRWVHQTAYPMLAGVVTTASDLVFTGEMAGDFLALDARDGSVLYRYPTNAPMGGGVITYAIGGTQYVAALSGRASSFLNYAAGGPARLLVFALR